MDEFTFSLSAWEDYCYWQVQDKKTLRKINELIKDIRRHGPLAGLEKPERLRYRAGYSRRIDDANRLVYDIDELKNIKIISCRGHYED